MLAVLFAPLLIVFGYSFLTRGAYGGVAPPWTIENYTRLFDPLYLQHPLALGLDRGSLHRPLPGLAFPLALYIASAGRHKTLLLNLVMLPFWTSFLIRTYAWMFLLRDTGLSQHCARSAARHP